MEKHSDPALSAEISKTGVTTPTSHEVGGNEKGLGLGLGLGVAAEPVSSAATDSTDLVNYANADGTFDDDVVVRTGADAAKHLLSLRDDFDPSITFRSLLLASCLCAFQAVMTQIYQFKPTAATISGTFVVLIAHFLGRAWAAFLPRGDLLEAKWREEHPEEAASADTKLPARVRFFKLLNPRPWSLKEHSICAITATSASNASASTEVFAAQNLFYDLPLSTATIILSTISIGLFGYGLCGILRPIAVWHVESVYWGTLPTVKTLQGLHWQEVKSSKPMRYFWYSYVGMFFYEFLPAYIWPWLNSVSIPCLAAMKTTGARAEVLTNVFGGSVNNEGLGLFNFSFDWQYIQSFSTSLPLTLQAHQAVGLLVCYVCMLSIYYGNAWGARDLPFMSTSLRQANGTVYPSAKVFVQGVLSEEALQTYGIPRLTGTFAFSMFMANAAIGALVVHCFLFWGKDVVKAFRDSKNNKHSDPHHAHMAKHYKEVPWTWYVAVLVISFVLGMVVVVKENVTLSPWAYVVSLLLGCFFAPLSTILYARFGNGIATNNLSKMIGGLAVAGRPVGNMYFASWSHNVISNTVTLCNDLKMGEYLKIPPRTMFLTQIYGTVLGGFVSYGVMVSIVTGNRDILTTGNGSNAWSGATIQAYNSNAASWALARYLYKTGARYDLVPIGMAVGGGIVALHWLLTKFRPVIRGFELKQINFPQLIQYAGYIPYNASQTCVLWSQMLAGFFCQYWLRNYRPRAFKNYLYLVTGAFDGASLTVLFILSFAVFGAGGKTVPFPQWWGNNADGYFDQCPSK